jgi:preprotein translocase subunit SecD
MMKRHSVRLIFIVVLVAAAIWVVLPNNPGIHVAGIDREVKVVQGLDLQGGLRVLLEADLPEDVDISSEQMQTARDIIEKRVNALGVTEPIVQIAGSRRILVELPGIGDPEEAVATIKETGLLEFIEIDRADYLQLGPGGAVLTDFGQSSAATALQDELPQTAQPTEAEQPAATTEAEPTPSPTAAIAGASFEDKVLHTVMTGAMLEDATVASD